jgi:hypothetical protein
MATVQCINSGFGDKQHLTLKKPFQCFLPFRVSVLWIFKKPYIEQAAGSEWGGKDLFGRTAKQAAIQLVISTQVS